MVNFGKYVKGNSNSNAPFVLSKFYTMVISMVAVYPGRIFPI